MKNFFIICLVFISINSVFESYLSSKQSLEEIKVIRKDQEDIFKLILAGNSVQSNILDYNNRIFHYLLGHNSGSFITGCSECGLLEQLKIRLTKINDEIEELSDFMAKNPQEVAASKKKLDDLMLEQKLATQKIFSADEKTRELSKLIRLKND